ncbi:glutamate-cysteine ligase family protein [Micromonosporaceae bacterium Da 78-11]
MKTLTEQAAELLIADHAFAPGMPGFVGAAVDLVLEQPGSPAGRLRHGFLGNRSPRVVTVSSPPSPGLASCLDRTAEALRAAATLTGPAALTTGVAGADDETAGVRVGLEAGLIGGGPFGLTRRWALAQTIAPVLAAAFANSPLRDGRPSGWRSIRQSRHRELPVPPAVDAPWAAWTAYVMDAPTPTGRSFRARTHDGPGQRPALADLGRHLDALCPPVSARGHLELDVADGQPGDGWRIVVAVTSALLDDLAAAETAQAATGALVHGPRVWERAARDGLTDPVLAAAARDCFLAAYAALARQGASRELRDAVAGFTERYVLRGRCPADDVLDRVTALP